MCLGASLAGLGSALAPAEVRMISRPPLEDPAYDPVHKPINRRPPAVVAKWGPVSQLRWFRRFWADLTPIREDDLKNFYCHSDQHKGACCASCLSEQEDGYYYTDGCCCRSERP